ncbi:MAG: CPA2 family monovalent cation:H+ antiporter-2 [Myxococcota bacterium]|jgi:CPA2 family monovalent cation:H+ antiporter-2
MDPMLPRLVAVLFVVVFLAAIGRRFSQPMPVVYLLAGVVLGPQALALLGDVHTMTRLGELGVILLLFLLGTEIKLDQLIASWRVPVLGLGVQVAGSLLSVAAVGWALDWPMGRVVLVGFVISLSSTAVVLRLLEDRKLSGTPLGNDVLAILLAQDLALAPMLIAIAMLGGVHVSAGEMALQLIGGAALIGVVGWTARQERVSIPGFSAVRDDPELQVFGALLVALSLALFSALVGLSAAFGAFVAGIVIGATEEERWIHHSLHPLRVLLVALFLMAVGMLLDIGFMRDNLALVLGLAGLALATNTMINAGILKALGRSTRDAVLGGALLSQIGEFSFVLAAIGAEVGLVSVYGHQLAMAVIAVTLLLSAAWITTADAAIRRWG